MSDSRFRRETNYAGMRSHGLVMVSKTVDKWNQITKFHWPIFSTGSLSTQLIFL